MSKEAMKLALEAITTYLSESPDPSEEAVEGLCDARAFLRKALAEQPAPVQQSCYCPNCEALSKELTELKAQPEHEPVAWAWRAFDSDDGHYGKWGTWKISDYKPPRQPDKWFQVVSLPYSAPPQRKPLTEEEMEKIAAEYWLYPRKFVRAIEAAHGIKENT